MTIHPFFYIFVCIFHCTSESIYDIVKREKCRKDQNMKKIILCLGILCCICAVGFLIYRYMPTSEQMDLKEQELIIGNVNTGTNFRIENDKLYLPLEVVNKYLNSRFYWDGEQILYTLPDKTVTYEPLVIEDNVWIEMSLVEQYTNITWQYLENPNRVWIWNKWDEELEYAKVKYNMAVRYRGGVKSPILTKISKGDTVQVLDTSIRFWTKVQTSNGVIGYIWSEALADSYKDIRKNEFEEIEYTNLSLGEDVRLMWHQELGTSGIEGLPAILETSKINVIAPSWFTVATETGEIQSRASKAYTDMAHEAGVQVWAMLDNINVDIDDYKLLSSTKSRRNLVKNVMKEIEKSGADGLNLDFESLGKNDIVHYLQLVREFSVACRTAGIILSVDNYVPINSNLYYNRTEQAKVVDYIMVMGYDEHWAGGEAGSTASYTFVENGVRRSLLEVPKEKLILAVPFFTRVWTITEEGTSSKAVGIKHIPDILKEWNVEKQWLEKEKQYYAEKIDGNTTQKIWIEDASSMQWKLDFVREYDLAGVAIWKANLENNEIWELEWE